MPGQPATPVSPKVVASAAGAGAGATVSSLILWILGVAIWDVPATASSAPAAVASVPSPIAGLIVLVVTVVSAAVPGYRTTDPLRMPARNPEADAKSKPATAPVGKANSAKPAPPVAKPAVEPTKAPAP